MLSAYPIISYNGDIITDISRRFIIKNIETEHSEDIYFEYLIKNWRSPENIAYDFYGSCDYIWLVLVINNIVDPIKDWLLPDDEIKKFIIEKYGRENIYNVHHYELNGIIYKNYVNGAKLVTNYEYENDKNEKKRKIKLIYPELVSSIESEAKKLFR